MTAATAIQVEMQKAIEPLSQRLTEYGNNFIDEHDKLNERLTGLEHVLAEQGSKLDGRFAAMNEITAKTTVKLDQLSKDFVESHDGLTEHLAKVQGMTNHANDRIDNIERPPVLDNSEIYTALVAAQLEITNAEALVDNEFTGKKYADLAAVMNAVKEPLAKNGLTIIQLTATKEEIATVDSNTAAIGIKTILAHTSGQSIVDIIAMVPPKMDPQGIGSCRTYMRRYGVLGICAIAGAIDDDAEGTKKDGGDYERISSQEAEAIIVKADELFGERADAALAKMLNRLFGGIERVGDIKAGEAEVAVTSLTNAAELMAKMTTKKQEVADKMAVKEKADKKKADEEKPPTKGREPGEEG